MNYDTHVDDREGGDQVSVRTIGHNGGGAPLVVIRSKRGECIMPFDGMDEVARVWLRQRGHLVIKQDDLRLGELRP